MLGANRPDGSEPIVESALALCQRVTVRPTTIRFGESLRQG